MMENRGCGMMVKNGESVMTATVMVHIKFIQYVKYDFRHESIDVRLKSTFVRQKSNGGNEPLSRLMCMSVYEMKISNN